MFRNPRVYHPDLEKEVGLGWNPPFPDMRDYSLAHPKVLQYDSLLGLNKLTDGKIPKSVNLAEYFPTIKDQEDLGSCTANAGSSIIEYYQNRAYENFISPSRLFIYKTTRNLLGLTGDTGAYLRTVMASLVYFGAPPEDLWKYNIKKFDNEPTSFVYGIADNYEALTYFCHDPLGQNKNYKEVLNSVKMYLSVGIPSMFGFYVFDSMNKGRDHKGNSQQCMIPFPSKGDRCVGGHAIVAIGYDDNVVIKRFKNRDEAKTTGAILILNSWGKQWGYQGLGWLPYAYVTNGYACDFWSILSMEWVETGQFGI